MKMLIAAADDDHSDDDEDDESMLLSVIIIIIVVVVVVITIIMHDYQQLNKSSLSGHVPHSAVPIIVTKIASSISISRNQRGWRAYMIY